MTIYHSSRQGSKEWWEEENLDEWGKTVDDKYVVRVIYKERQFCIASHYSREEHLHEMLGQTQKAGLN